MCGVDLPYVEFLVLLEAGVDLVAVEALGETPLHHVGHLDDTRPALRNHVFDDLVHLVRDVLRPAEQTWKIDKVLRQEGGRVTISGRSQTWKIDMDQVKNGVEVPGG